MAEQEPTLVKRAAALLAAALVIWALVLLIGGRGGVLATLRARALLNDLESRIGEQRTHNDELREEIQRLREDDAAVEEVAREELLMIRDDEVVLVVPDVPAGSGQRSAPQQNHSPHPDRAP